MFIPGFLITLCTFPGIIFHELGHEWFCRWTRVPVHEVCYFRLGDPAGYVIHEKPEKFYQAFLIALGPLITGTVIALFIFSLSLSASLVHPYLEALLFWLGMSIAVNAFPSVGDAENLWQETNHHVKHSIAAIVGYPFVLFIYIANLLNFFWFDFLYAGILYHLAKWLLRTY